MAVAEELKLSLDVEAAERLAALIADAGKGPAVLRLAVRGGGCSGFQYSLALDEAADDEDLVFESEGQTIVCDKVSFPYVAGSTICYRNDLEASGFEVDNPNAVAACGCGSSFTVE
jgi:iron-sulfur cluster assembly protein